MTSGDITWSAIRANWPILIIIATLIAGGVRTEMNIESNHSRLAHLERMLGSKELTSFAKWQVNVERDIKELKKVCK
jgi:hypothetical protein